MTVRIDLTGLESDDGFVVQGDNSFDKTGFAVSSAGDVNGDGFIDLIIGAPSSQGAGYYSGQAAVIFGTGDPQRGTVDLTNLSGSAGFIIQADGEYDNAGQAVSSAGDVNGDGLDDLIVGVPFDGSGKAYVIFGVEGIDRNPILLSNLSSTDGFFIETSALSTQLGQSVSAAGDVNDDGIDDLIVGAPRAGNVGTAYVIYGVTGLERDSIDVSDLSATDGFGIEGEASFDELGRSVSSAGDVNGDGIDDLIVGAPEAGSGAGAAYVIYGTADSGRGTVDVADLSPTEGFVIEGDVIGDLAGRSVSSAGDANGDGIDDLIVGVPDGNAGGYDAGEAYVIYGVDTSERATVDLAALSPTDGFLIQGDTLNDEAGLSVSHAGDVNGDGIDDVIVGAPFGDDGGVRAGEAYIVYGTPSTQRGTVDLTDLSDANGFIIQGDAADDRAGFAVSSAGDVDGDGLDDIIVGAFYGDNGGTNAGEAYVVYGFRSPRQGVDLSGLSERTGFVIQGNIVDGDVGRSVSSAGDVNGDGIDDVIVGAPYVEGVGVRRGQAYVIYGVDSAQRPLLDLADLTPSEGFIIQGNEAYEQAGFAVSSAGDVNGDGIDDVIAGAPFGDDGGTGAGEAYVIYGTRDTGRGPIDMADLSPSEGFIIQGDAARDFAGRSVSSAGDVNGDGIDDLIVGAPGRNSEATPEGRAFVVYGTADAERDTVDLTNLSTSDGFVLQGVQPGNEAGYAVSSAGDVNGDGIDDLIIGARFGYSGGSNSGEAYVVYGTRDTERGAVDLADLSISEGFLIQGDTVGDQTGFAVSSAGDVNGDGIDDLIIGAPLGDDGGESAGEAYVIYGVSGSKRTTVDLTDLSAADGFIIQGGAVGDIAGSSVSSAGDVNGDGIDDVIVGAESGDGGGSSAGEAYVIYGELGTVRGTVDLADLSTEEGFIILGDTVLDRAGRSVSAAGDVNNDGIDDVIVGAPGGDDGGNSAGEAYVIYGMLATEGEDVLGRIGFDASKGTSGRDVMTGVAGTNLLDGGLSADLLIGGFDNDTLSGGLGDDILVGDNNALLAGADVLSGGFGDDLLEGGGGADVFVFRPNEDSDIIGQINIDYDDPTNSAVIGPDFVSGVDRVQLLNFEIESGDAALAAMRDVDGVATFSAQGTTITFAGLTVADFAADDFIF